MTPVIYVIFNRLTLSNNFPSSATGLEDEDILLNSIGPLNWFSLKLTHVNEGTMNKDVGKGPKNEFPPTSICSNLWNRLMLDGNMDLNLLLLMTKTDKLVA